MAITKAKKSAILEELKTGVASAPSVVFLNFHGLPVAGANALRRDLQAQAIGLKVAKKTLLRLAFRNVALDGEMPALDGEVATAYATGSVADPLAVPRTVQEFAKSHAEQVKILGGVFEGRYVSAALMLELALIPAREVLLARLLNLLNSPIQRLALVLNALAAQRPAA